MVTFLDLVRINERRVVPCFEYRSETISAWGSPSISAVRRLIISPIAIWGRVVCFANQSLVQQILTALIVPLPGELNC